jgi:predicted alpha/beta superfamily hydrolase
MYLSKIPEIEAKKNPAMRNKNRFSLFMIALIALTGPGTIFGQDISIKICSRHSIKSEILQKDRNVLIHLPDNYSESNKSYPVLYQVMGDSASILEIVSTVNRLAHGEKIMPEMIIVAIETIEGKDLWPTNSKFYPEPAAIGANDFLTFIEKDLIPYVENKYRTKDDRILYGQSMTSVFTIYTFLERPELFNSYIASSGAFPGCESFFKELSLKSFEQIDQFNGQKLFITNGLNDPLNSQVDALGQMTDFSSLLKDELGMKVGYKYLTYENGGHVPFHSLYDGLRFIYESDQKE